MRVVQRGKSVRLALADPLDHAREIPLRITRHAHLVIEVDQRDVLRFRQQIEELDGAPRARLMSCSMLPLVSSSRPRWVGGAVSPSPRAKY